MTTPRRALVLLVLALGVARVWTAPQSLAGAGDRTAAFRFRGDDGRDHALLGDVDSYLWVRLAANWLRTGTVCDAVVDGACRDTHANAPVGVTMKYARSLHVAAIVAVHRVATAIAPGFPLEASAALVPVLVAIAMVVPAYALGRRLAGEVGGIAAALLVTTNPSLLGRALGSDDDVWNVALPLALAAAIAAALDARSRGRQVAWAVTAAAIVGLHAAVWRGWPFTWLVALLACVATAALRRLRRQSTGGRDAALVGIVFWVVSGVAVAGADVDYLRLPFELLLGAPAAVPVAGGHAQWPDVFATVAELVTPWRAVIAEGMGGPAYFLLGWLGLLALLLPRRGWTGPDFAILVGGTLLYRQLVVLPDVGARTLLLALAVPAGAAVALRVLRGARPDDPIEGAALLVAIWLLAALHAAVGTARFVFLLSAPSGLAIATALGRTYEWANHAVASWPGRRVWQAALLVGVAAVLATPVARGWSAARTYLPVIDTAWRDALLGLRAATPADAIVFTWWDYGYWTEWFADRRVPADGASLRTHVPYWTARALAAPDPRTSLGLLRMLACGSDTTPEPEGRDGAFGRLVAAGLDELAAHDLVMQLADLDRAAATTLLAARGLPAATRDAVLAATHCTPPPSYLVLSSEQIGKPGWALLGTWDVHTGTRPDGMPGVSDWMPCTRQGEDLACPGFTYRGLDPAASRFDGRGPGTAPAMVLLVGDGGIEPVAAAPAGRIGVLVDPARDRVAMGPPALLRSTFVALVLLEGRFTSELERVDARVGARDERLSVWRIRWPALP